MIRPEALAPVSYTHLDVYKRQRYNFPVPSSFEQNEKKMVEGKLPSFGTVVAIILLPLFLIILNTLSSVIPFMKPLNPVLTFLGTPVIALLLSTITAMVLLGMRHGYTRDCLLYTSIMAYRVPSDR